MSRRSLSPTALPAFLEWEENHKEKREGTREWLIFFFSYFPTITTHQSLCDYNFQACNFAFKSCLLSNGFGGIGRSRGSCGGPREEGSCVPRNGIQWKLFQKYLLVWWVNFSFTSTFFFSFCNLICTKRKQWSSASKNMYEWVCIQERQRQA